MESGAGELARDIAEEAVAETREQAAAQTGVERLRDLWARLMQLRHTQSEASERKRVRRLIAFIALGLALVAVSAAAATVAIVTLTGDEAIPVAAPNTAALPATDAPAAGDSGTAAAPQPEDDPILTVSGFYQLLTERQYAEAYTLLTPELQASADFAPFEGWVQGYGQTTSVRPTRVTVQEQSEDRAVVLVELEATDGAASGAVIQQRFAGTWTLVRSNGRWLLDGAQIDLL